MSDQRFGVFGVGPHLVAIPAEHVQEMFVLSDVRKPPGMPAYQRGVTRLRTSALPAIDLRVCLGLASAETELAAFQQLLRDREQDHRAWLAELEASTREGRPFKLATDPRQCKFGVWYYAFETDDAVVRGAMQAFEQPHAEIHALAGKVEVYKVAGQLDQALQIIEQARLGLLSELIAIFERTRQVVREQQKEVGIVVHLRGRAVVLVVDRAEAVADLEEIAQADDPLHGGPLRVDLVPRLARWRGAPQPVLVLDLERVAALGGG